MGHAETGDKKRSLSSPSLFRRFSITSQSSTKTTRSTLAVRARWASLTSPNPRPSSHPSVSPGRTSTVEEEGDDDEQQGPGFLPLIRIASPLDLFADKGLPQAAQRDPATSRHKHKRSTSWGELVAIFAGRSSDGDDPLVTNSDSTKRKPKFTLESPSDLDLSRQPSLQAMRPAFPPPGTTLTSPVASSSSLASAPGMTTSTLRPHLVRRDASSNPSRRYTFAMAMTDEDISDETLVQELERIRAVNAMSGNSSGDLEEFWDLSQAHSPFGSTSGESSKGFFEGVPCESPIERVDVGLHIGVAVTSTSPQQERRMPCRASLPAFPVHHRLSTASSSSPSGPSTSSPNSERTSMIESSDASWHTARRTLLTCRECVRTERHYLYSMRTLVSQDTASPPPPLMVQYAENLVEMSERLLARMEENPNVWGVTTAFLGEETALEHAFVDWCGKVGAWFEGNSVHDDVKGKGRQLRDNSQDKKALSPNPSKGKLNDSRSTVKLSPSSWKKDQQLPDSLSSPSDSVSSSSSSSSSSSGTSASSATTPATSVASSASPSKPATPSPAATTNPTISFYPCSLLNRKKDKEMTKMTSISQSVGIARQDSSSSSGSSNSGNGAARTTRKSAVRDLAILPTQRVMRYVLLFKDLLAHTPSTSPTRALVERAVHASVRIADKCDQAQNHAAFSRIPPPPPPKDSILPRMWARHANHSMTRDTLPFGSSRKSASENGHGSCTTDIAALGSMSVPPTRPPSTHGEKSSPKVLVKPKRSSSTGAMGAVLPAFTTISTAKTKDKDPDHTLECNKLSNKLKKRPGGSAPPPSAFPLKTHAPAWL